MVGKKVEVEPVITVSGAELENVSTRPLEVIQGFRTTFDVKPTRNDGQPVDMRMYLRVGNQPLTETWLYQWTPPPTEQRRL